MPPATAISPNMSFIASFKSDIGGSPARKLLKHLYYTQNPHFQVNECNRLLTTTDAWAHCWLP